MLSDDGGALPHVRQQSFDSVRRLFRQGFREFGSELLGSDRSVLYDAVVAHDGAQELDHVDNGATVFVELTADVVGRDCARIEGDDLLGRLRKRHGTGSLEKRRCGPCRAVP